jgi:hypothetical protein
MAATHHILFYCNLYVINFNFHYLCSLILARTKIFQFHAELPGILCSGTVSDHEAVMLFTLSVTSVYKWMLVFGSEKVIYV